MKHLIAGLRVAQQGLIELLLYFPIILVLTGYVLEGPIQWIWLIGLPLGYPIGYFINLPLSFRHPFPVILLAVIGGLLYGYGFGLFDLSRIGIMAFLAAAFGMFRGGTMLSLSWHERIGISRYAYSLLFYFLVSAIFLRFERFEDYSWLLLAGGAASLLLFLFLSNRHMVGEETLSGDQEPKVEATVKRHNRVMVILIVGLTVFLVLAIQLQALFSSLGGAIVALLNKLLSGESREELPAEMPPNEPAPPPQLPKGGEPSPIWDILTYVLLTVVAVLLLWVILRIMKHVPGWLRLLRERLARLFGRERVIRSQGYVDEVESIWKPGRFAAWFRGSSRESRLKWKDLPDNESRIRYLYRQWLGQRVKAGYAYKPHLTPVETGSELSEQLSSQENEMAELLVNHYGSVRYGKKAISDAELERLQAATTPKHKNKRK
ncbi:DUF4129 domain-containing protein [Paenibacillus mendelii]|uniref:DUF4129 domain-containing protein n=1 Tax=Paenibacillus mendelii TaxID=206163 RepID=A0ABV6J788_9BACL|nr:DUF4129 domain-containing protein [Paenibacillus mendelii]MCQ6562090.1 DUF4129 domain-containing protein [Paenibacillus mendelii]